MSQTRLYYQPVQDQALDLSLKRKKIQDEEEETVKAFIPFKRSKSSPPQEDTARKQEKTREENNNRLLSFEGGRKSKSKTQKKIAQIREMCDCRFCYEDHILRMRLKLSNML